MNVAEAKARVKAIKLTTVYCADCQKPLYEDELFEANRLKFGGYLRCIECNNRIINETLARANKGK